MTLDFSSIRSKIKYIVSYINYSNQRRTMGEYYKKKAAENHASIQRRSREAHEGIDRQVNGKRPDARNTSRYTNGGEAPTTSDPKPKSKSKAKAEAAGAVSSTELTIVTFYSLASALGAVAAAALLGRRGHNS